MPLRWLARGLRSRLLPTLTHGCALTTVWRRRRAAYQRMARLALGRPRGSAVSGLLADLDWPPFQVPAEEETLRAAAALGATAAATSEG